MQCALANPIRPWMPTEQFISRVQRAYRIGVAALNIPKGTTWHTIGGMSSDLHRLLMSDKRKNLPELLANPRRTDLYYGMDTLCRSIMDNVLASPISNHDAYGKSISDSVRKLAEALGVVRVYNPEFQSTTEIEVSLEALLERIDAHLGVHVEFPNPFPDELGIQTVRGIASNRAIQAIYQAKRAADLADGGRIVEIGGGVGRTAYYALALGVQDYVIVDIPMSLVGQACFLAATLGEDAVVLEGEEPSPRNHPAVRLLAPSSLHSAGQSAVTINVDSFTEMGREHAENYVRYCSGNTPILLSINHETNPFTARELFSKRAKVSRYPYWMREGYVEEIATF